MKISKTEYHIIRNTFVDNLEREVGQKIDDSLFESIDVALGDTFNVDWDDEREESVIYGIVFDDFNVCWWGLWSQICDSCISEHQIDDALLSYVKIDDALLLDGSSGMCGVKGCRNNSTHYIDFIQNTESEVK